ncbi:MAG: tannase/feruloyl esterase family alpha/beta hydrolase, partial [Betaproteobacteria bacterium]|nr:tannase/feruloyl esterase family alpha/beta hydrolase [Betaproteobacteria bacterium]
MKLRSPFWIAACGTVALGLAACGGNGGPNLPVLPAASPGTLVSCTDLASKATFAGTTYSSAALVPAGTLALSGVPVAVPEHCLVKGEMNRRTSSVDGASYAIGFEMRLPTAWNGRYYYQANGGIDGSVSTAHGANSGYGPASQTALQMGFAVISSDA